MTYDLKRFLNVRTARAASFGPEGEQVSFLLDTTGVYQVWTLDGPQAWPEQRTFYDERVTFADYSPVRDELVFGMDQGGDEHAQFYLLDGDDGTITPLTEHPDAKHRWGGWSSDGERFAFASNRRNPAEFDIYVQHRTERGDDATMVYEGDGWISVVEWSPDDEQLLVHEARSNFDHDVYVLDATGGDLRHLTPHEGEVRYQSLEWGPNGDAVYCCTDDGSDTMYLARVDVETGDMETVEDGGEWNVDGIEVDQDSGRFVYTRNVDGYTDVTVAEFTGETTYDTFPDPDVDGDVMGAIDFAPGADRFVITTNSRTENGNVHVVDVESGEATRWTNAPTAGIPRETFVDTELVHFESFDGREIPAFFSLPEDYEAGQTPVVVDIHGGPESQRRPAFSPVTQYFLHRGYAVFEPNVRGSSGYGKAYTHLDDVEKRMDSVKDIRAGVDWLHDHPVVDQDRIAAMGGSYGGFMVLAALTEYPDLWAAGVDIVGIANFVTFLENTGDWRRSLREAEYGSLEDDREFLEEISPTNNVEHIAAPLFVAHGANDPRVPVGEAEQIAEEAEKQGVPVELLVFEDEGHGFSKLENRIEAYTSIVDFLDDHV